MIGAMISDMEKHLPQDEIFVFSARRIGFSNNISSRNLQDNRAYFAQRCPSVRECFPGRQSQRD